MYKIYILSLSFISTSLFGQPLINVDRNQPILLKDGTTLYHDFYSPKYTKKKPVLLIRTPYQKEGIKIVGRFFAENGFGVIIQDVRGKYSSEGAFIPFLNEYKDGVETLNWVQGQDWFNGDLGMWGSSYLGFSALVLSNSNHPALKSIFNLSGWINGIGISEVGGAFHQQMVIPWLLFEGQKTQLNLDDIDLDDIFLHTPLIDVLPNMRFQDKDEVYQLEHITKEFESFVYSEVNIPIMHVNGWFDFTISAGLNDFKQLKKHANAPQSMIVGPWYHNQLYDENPKLGDYQLPVNGSANMEWMLKQSLSWFQQTLIDQKKLDDDQIRYYVLFQDEWKESPVWPPKNTQFKNYYLFEDRLIASVPDSDQSGSKTFEFNPENPVPTTGGANFNFFLDEIGIQNQDEIELRDDVLIFTSVPLQNDQIFAGSHSVSLFVSTTGKGTDFTAKLTKVDADSRSQNILDGIVRVSQKDLIRNTTKITIKLGDSAFLIKKGERVRLQISSSNFPKFSRNPNTGVEPMEAEIFRKATQTVLFSKTHPSHVQLQILKQ